MLSTILGIALPWLIVSLLAWVVFELLRMNGRVLLRLDALQDKVAALAIAPTVAAPGGD